MYFSHDKVSTTPKCHHIKVSHYPLVYDIGLHAKAVNRSKCLRQSVRQTYLAFYIPFGLVSIKSSLSNVNRPIIKETPTNMKEKLRVEENAVNT